MDVTFIITKECVDELQSSRVLLIMKFMTIAAFTPACSLFLFDVFPDISFETIYFKIVPITVVALCALVLIIDYIKRVNIANRCYHECRMEVTGIDYPILVFHSGGIDYSIVLSDLYNEYTYDTVYDKHKDETRIACNKVKVNIDGKEEVKRVTILAKSNKLFELVKSENLLHNIVDNNKEIRNYSGYELQR